MNFRDLHKRAYECNPYETDMLDEIYRNTDMEYREYFGHLKILAGIR